MRAGLLAGVALALALAAAIRFPGIDTGLPQMEEPDTIFVDQALAFEAIRADPGESTVDRRVMVLYPHLLGRLLDALPGTLVRTAPPDAPLAEHLAAAAWPHVAGRWIVAVLSLLVVPAVFCLALPHLAAGWALLAAVFAGTSLLGLTMASQARPHAALYAFVAWALVGAQRLVRAPSRANVALASASSGLAIATLHSGLATLPPIALAAAFALRSHGVRILARLVFLAAGPFAALWFFYPFLWQSKLWGERPFPADALNGAGFQRVAQTVWGYEPALVILALVALVPGRWLARAGAGAIERWVLAAFFVPYFIAIGLYYTTWHRFALPLFPVVALVAAAGARRLASVADRRGAKPALQAAIAVVAAAFPVLTSVRFAYLRCRSHPTELAARWMEENLDPARTRMVLSYGIDLPLMQSPEATRSTIKMVRSPWQDYLHRHEEAPAAASHAWELTSSWVRPERRADPARIAVIDVKRRLEWFQATHVLMAGMRGWERALSDETPQAMESLDARLLARFAPYDAEDLTGAIFSNERFGLEAAAIVWRARAFGPTLELYEIPASGVGKRE